jgi:AmmeMemoRadiSam system protein B
MTRKFVVPLLIAAALGGAAVFRSPKPPENILSTSPVIAPIPTIDFLDWPAAERAWANTQSMALPQGVSVAGVVNHHVLASDLLARFAKTLKTARPDVTRIVILSPDHFHAGRGRVSTTRRPYATPFGIVPIATSTNTLVSKGLAVVEDGPMFEHEHGVGALIPFLAHEYDHLEVIPLALSSQLESSDLELLSTELASLMDEHTFLLVSSDMSHYLTKTQAYKNDSVTLGWLTTRDIAHMQDTTDDFTDNGVALAAVFMTWNKLHDEPKFLLIDHAISSDYDKNESYTTSYITGFWIN